MRIEYHRTLLADRVRIAAFECALRKLIRPGETVVADIGAGTGILGLLASRLGAKDIFLYESAAVAGVAQAILKKNRARNCHLMPFSSIEIDDPPRVDLIVSETLGNYALEEDIVTTMNDALKRHLKPGGTVIPAGIVQYVAPVVDRRVDDELSIWQQIGGLLDFSPAEELSRNNVYVRCVKKSELFGGMSGAKVWDELDLTKANKVSRKGVARWVLQQDLRVYGFAVWWEAQLAPDVMLSTAPWAPHTHWEQLYFPISKAIDTNKGDTVQILIRSRSGPETGTHLAWTVSVEDKSGRIKLRYAHDLDRGYLP